MHKKYFKLITILLVCMMMTIMSPFSYGQNTDNAPEQALNVINAVRENVGVGVLTSSFELRQAALTHAQYMSHHQSFSIIEESDRPFYRGRFPLDRANYFRFGNPYVTELIMNTDGNFPKNIQGMLDNPYARVVLLDPKYQQIGMRFSEPYSSYVLGGNGNSQTLEVIYPYANQKDVPIRWTNIYRHSPYMSSGLSENRFGLPITYAYYDQDDALDDIIVNRVVIENKNGQAPFDYEIRTPSSDRFLSNAIMILPLSAYDFDTTYQITLDLTIKFEGKSNITTTKQFSFQTQKNYVQNSQMTMAVATLLTRGDFVESLIRTMDLNVVVPNHRVFSDVDTVSDRSRYIYTAYYYGLVKGKTEDTFGPDMHINRQEAYTILVRALETHLGKSITPSMNRQSIGDYMNLSPWAIENQAILKALASDFLVLNANNHLMPQGHLTKAEFDQIMVLYKAALK